jgi:hypothetical protein
MAFKPRDALLAVALFILLIAALLLAGYIDAPEIEAHDRWYAELSQETWCL